jgi:hypothetical protein
MKLLSGWVISAGLMLTTAAANAQGVAPIEIGRPAYIAVSDVEGPYAAMPQEAPVPGYYAPRLLPPQEVFAILRENGFSPLGVLQQHGLLYSIAAIDRGGEDGRLLIDARNGRIVRFMPAYRMGPGYRMDPGYRMGDNFSDEPRVIYGPAGQLAPIGPPRSGLRPPADVPRLASRTPSVPMPKASPLHGGEIKPSAAPAQQSAAAQVKPAEAPVSPVAPPAPVDAKPAAPSIQPSQEMPKVQGLE